MYNCVPGSHFTPFLKFLARTLLHVEVLGALTLSVMIKEIDVGIACFQVDTLLESFCNDAGITIESAIQGITKLNQIPDLREVFKVS